MIIRLCLIILVSITTMNLYSGTIDPNTSDQKYIEYGKEFHYVGKLCGTYEDGTKFCASAVAISDRWILTAAHVVQNANQCFVYINNKKICITKFFYKKEFDKGLLGENDIAIGYCEEDIGLDIYPALYTTNDEVGKKCSISGFGITGTFLSGAIRSDKHKRAGTNTIDSIFNHTLVCSPSHRASKDYTDTEFIIASGDSGGGLFIDGKLAGINSFVMAEDRDPNSSYTDESCHTRISIFVDWIEQTINE